MGVVAKLRLLRTVGPGWWISSIEKADGAAKVFRVATAHKSS